MRFARSLVALLAFTAIARGEATATDPRAALDEQIRAELETIDKTVATVGEKLTAAEAAQTRRVRAAYRILRAPLASDASPNDRMASARRRAAARLLLERDRDERALLASELGVLGAAKETTTRAAAAVPTITLPESLLVPVRGSVARAFGTIVHDRSKATLSRRGIDFDVESGTPVVAPADGVVRYAGPMRGLDRGIVLDHGDYFTILGKLGDVAIPAGTKVTRGDRLGRPARQRVYFEVRAKIGPGGLPLDPAPLIGPRSESGPLRVGPE